MLVQLYAPHFCAGLVVQEQRVTDAAPIVRYMLGWSASRVLNYCRQKGWRTKVVSRD